jgi:ornithine cyclodeaminase/alanine dehydrogenase-like protein (mu-crystallin family)
MSVLIDAERLHRAAVCRNRERASSLAVRINETLGLHAEPVDSLDRALSQADIISTVTAAFDPILPGRSLRPGTHIDLIGGYTPLMREIWLLRRLRGTLRSPPEHRSPADRTDRMPHFLGSLPV